MCLPEGGPLHIREQWRLRFWPLVLRPVFESRVSRGRSLPSSPPRTHRLFHVTASVPFNDEHTVVTTITLLPFTIIPSFVPTTTLERKDVALNTPMLEKSVASAWSTGWEVKKAGGLQEALHHLPWGPGQVLFHGDSAFCVVCVWTLGHLWPHLSVTTDLGKPNTLGKACSDPSPPSQEGGGPAVSSGGGVHHQGRPGGNGQRSCPRLT